MFTIENKSEAEDKDYNKEDIYIYNKYGYPKIKDYYNPSLFNKEFTTIFKINNIKTNNEEEDSEDSETKTSSLVNPTIFKIINQKKRGRESKNQRKAEHLSSNFDNLQTKIQVNFLTFIVNLSNDVLKAEFGKKTSYNFKQIDYKLKKVISHKNVQKLKNMTIKELLKMKISPKNKKCTSFNNNQILNDVCKESQFVDNFFDMKYLEVFSKFYYSEDKVINKIEFEGKQIILSTKTRSFYKLLKKYEGLKSLLIDTAKSVYFNGYDKLIDHNSFKIMKNEGILIDLKE